jgi:hypothetical protein
MSTRTAKKIPDKLRREVAGMVGSLWWTRCLLATEADHLGLILRAVMAKPTLNPPWLGPSAIIDEQGIVLSNYVDEHNHMTFAKAVCHIDDLLDNLRRLCDSLKLSDVHANALFDMVRQWIKSDVRPHTEQAEDRVPIEYRTTH